MAKSTKSTVNSTATPGITKRSDGKYLARYRAPDHKERTKTCKTVREAKVWRELERTKMVVGDWVDPVLKRTKFREFADPWIKRRGDKAERTVELYQHLLTAHILPTFGKLPFGSIRVSTVEEWHAELSQRHAITAAKAYRLLAQIMRAAIADGYLAKSPCQVKGGGVEVASERPTASIAEANALAEGMPDHLQLVVHLALWCQLRRAELLGLRRSNVDLLHQTISIRETRVRLMSGEMITKEPKSDKGVRTLVVPPHVMPLLAEHLERFVENKASAYVFTGQFGRPLLPQVLETAWKRSRTSVGRPDLRLHDMRHSGLTLAAVTGATIAELMQRAGHGSTRAAIRYQHVAQDRDRVLADALSALVMPADVIPITRAQKL
jgi:integrase